jgi:hypothetical protein
VALLTYAALVVGALACWSFVVLYTIHYRWWTNQFGRYIAAFSTSLGALLTHILVFSIWPDLPWRVPVRTVLFVSLVVVIVHQLLLFMRVIRADVHRSDRASPGGDE